MDSRDNRSKSEESVKIGILALFHVLFHIKTGHKWYGASIELF